MVLFALAFFLGDCFLLFQTDLPNIILIAMVSVVLFICLLSWWGLRLYFSYHNVLFEILFKLLFGLFGLCLGALWSTWYACSALSFTLPKTWENKPLWVQGQVVSLPMEGPFGTEFNFRLSAIQENQVPKIEISHVLVRLIWQQQSASNPVVKHALKVGDEWQFRVKLKRIHGIQSPGAFDFEAWALQNGIRASGHVVNDDHDQFLKHDWYVHPIDQFRQYIYIHLQPLLPISTTAPWLTALIIGERSNISSENWQVLRNTGTNHLMAIAGLHIGVIAGLAYLLMSWSWSRIPSLMLYLPAPTVAHVSALITGVLFSALAGFSLPTQRACLMLAMITITSLTKRYTHPWNIWALALFFVLLIDPLCLLTESFWLSFTTIALIIYCMHARVSSVGYWWKWGRVQWVIGVGLVPVSLALFQQCSLISFVANSIAVPGLSIFILPLCFLGGCFVLIFPPLAVYLFSIADMGLGILWQILTWLSQWDHSVFIGSVPGLTVFILSMLCVFFLLLPGGTPGKWLGTLWALPLLLHPVAKPKLGEIWLSLLDVGQGLSVIIQTKQHILLYDTGLRYSKNRNSGEEVILPYLHTIAAKKLDMLVISHGDMDHIGGAYAIMKSLPIDTIKTSVPEKIRSQHTDYCQSNEAWEWDKVKFSFLYPTQNAFGLGNDSSCVLKIDNGKQSILLTGDIEKRGELGLLTTVPEQLSADILIAPHHGSKTSGLKHFIAKVHPQIVLYATGYLNRYHFPHASTIFAYKELGSKDFNTVDSGTLVFKLSPADQHIDVPEQYRKDHHRFWFES